MNLLISFSGGETSAYMTYHIVKNGLGSQYEQAEIVFANTGEENEQTLRFVQQCSETFGWNVRWVEAVVHHRERKGCSHKVVDFSSASRKGEPYEGVIQKYGIPNQSFPHCTRELKTNPIYSYLRSIGWRPGTYRVAIGIRADEAKRCDKSADTKGIIYPLVDLNISKRDVNSFWSRQKFRLYLAGYQGNCKWCWKKSDRKLLTILDESPEKFEFPDRMERLYGNVGAEFRKEAAPDYAQRTFFRQHRSVRDLKMLHAIGAWETAKDDTLDIDSGCVEACEIEWGEHESTTSDACVDGPSELVYGKEK